ncbi:unnamed protein product [Vicia faba]|uniref:Uncharacterized protein n=1 Tax=Vicia faba TaxID=3906 RepID=A0AAV0ZHN9_VICFA|nr:unnamed protein product [Vicia faba]
MWPEKKFSVVYSSSSDDDDERIFPPLRSSREVTCLRKILYMNMMNFLFCFLRNKESEVDSLWSKGESDWSGKWAEGRFVGILIVWRKGLFVLISSFVEEGFLGIRVFWKGLSIYLVNVYFSCLIDNKRLFWEKLKSFKVFFSKGLWCVGRDFDVVRSFDERIGVSDQFNQRELDEFNDFVYHLDLVDVPLMGNKFTWFNLEGGACSRLDRFLISWELCDLWKIKEIMVGEWSLLDHYPLLLVGNHVDWGPNPFKLFKCSFDHEEFLPFVENVWNYMVIRGKAGFILKEKLCILKSKLKLWNKEVFGVLDLNVDKAASTQ